MDENKTLRPMVAKAMIAAATEAVREFRAAQGGASDWNGVRTVIHSALVKRFSFLPADLLKDCADTFTVALNRLPEEGGQ
jgi:hypothetical protein